MGKRRNNRNAFFIANNARAASNHTHGVSCNHPKCDDFDPNVPVDKIWYCERHGGANNVARANAKDDANATSIPGNARRARLARFRARNKAPMHPGNAILFAQWEEQKNAPKVVEPKPKKAKKKVAKKTERQKMLETLGLTEADLASLRG